MKIAIRENEVFIDYAERFDDETITNPPYNYSLAEVPDDIAENIKFSDFDFSGGAYAFHAARYEKRTADEAEREYKTHVDTLIRARYSIADEIAILRQRDVKPDEYAEYDAYCEACKAEARAESAKGV